MRSLRSYLLIAVLAAVAIAPARAAPAGGPVILEGLRIVTDWLNDPTYGVNALRATTPHEEVGGYTIPALATIVDETRDGTVALDRVPAQTPALMVTMVEPAHVRTDIEDARRDTTVRIRIRYAAEKSAAEQGTRDALYTLRTILRSVKQLMNQPGNAARFRNQVELVNVGDDYTITPVYQPVEDKVINLGLDLDLLMRDNTP